MQIYTDEECGIDESLLAIFQKAGEFCLLSENVDANRTEISLSLVGKDEIQSINREYRNTDSVTDVLSFPQFENTDELPENGEIVLGDVVICTERALEQAEEYGHSKEREMVYLFVHSMFHLLGYDHMTDEEKSEMRTKEESVMEKLNLKRE